MQKSLIVILNSITLISKLDANLDFRWNKMNEIATDNNSSSECGNIEVSSVVNVGHISQ